MCEEGKEPEGANVMTPDDFVVYLGERLTTLGQMEHLRWNAYHYANGWQRADTRNDLLRVHPDLVNWEELDVATQNKDKDKSIRT